MGAGNFLLNPRMPLTRTSLLKHHFLQEFAPSVFTVGSAPRKPDVFCQTKDVAEIAPTWTTATVGEAAVLRAQRNSPVENQEHRFMGDLSGTGAWSGCSPLPNQARCRDPVATCPWLPVGREKGSFPAEGGTLGR